MKRSRPRRHVRSLSNGKKVLVNPGVIKTVRKDYVGEIISQIKKDGRSRVPELGVFIVKKKPATKDRKGINPFTKEEMIFKAKPASKVIKFRPATNLKESITR